MDQQGSVLFASAKTIGPRRKLTVERRAYTVRRGTRVSDEATGRNSSPNVGAGWFDRVARSAVLKQLGGIEVGQLVVDESAWNSAGARHVMGTDLSKVATLEVLMTEPGESNPPFQFLQTGRNIWTFHQARYLPAPGEAANA